MKKIAFIKFGGLSAGGTERWLQEMAVSLVKFGYNIDFFYCDTAPYIGSSFIHPGTDNLRKTYLHKNGVNLIEFKVKFKDISTRNHEWIDSNFWDVFDQSKYLFVQTAKAGHAEYPYTEIDIPVVEYVTLDAGVDDSRNIVWTIHLSQWQRKRWVQSGGKANLSSVIPVPVHLPSTAENLRAELGLSVETLTFGFHQRASDLIASPIPLQAFAELNNRNFHFIIMGGGDFYKSQASDLGLDNISFLPHDSDPISISKFLNTLDVYTHGRKDGETFGTVLAESLIHGVPCISHASLTGANAQQETMGPGGYFVTNKKNYVEKMKVLIKDRELRSKMGINGRAHALEYYSIEACSEKLMMLYENIFGLKSPSSNLKSTLEYALTPFGFLMSGDVSDPASIANCGLVGGKPEEYDLGLLSSFARSTDTFIDIGANIGLYSSVFANQFEDMNIHAIEPQIECANYLEKTILLNQWENRYFISNIALGSENGRAKLQLTGSGSSINTNFNNEDSLPVREVVLKTLDDWCQEKNIEKLSMLKIDVEGCELDVLLGGKERIAKDSPIIFVEVAKTISERNYENHNFSQTFEYFYRLQYRIYVSNGINWTKKFSNRRINDGVAMYLCVPKSSNINFLRIVKYSLIYGIRKRYSRISGGVRYFFKKVRFTIQRHM